MQSPLKYYLLSEKTNPVSLAVREKDNNTLKVINQLNAMETNCDLQIAFSFRNISPFLHFLLSKILPFGLALTVIINILLCITLNRPNMRTPTNFLLLAISVADLLTCLFPLPILAAFNTDYFDTNITVTKGYIFQYLNVIFPTLCHNISIWLTVFLALQRFIYVVKPLEVHIYAICHYRGVAIGIFIITILSIACNASYFIWTFRDGFAVCADNQGAISIIHSGVLKCTFLAPNFFYFLLLLRIFIGHIIPCLLLCILTGYMMAALKGIAKKRSELLKKKSEMEKLTESLRSSDLNHTTNNSKRSLKRSKKHPSHGDAYKTSLIMLGVLILFLIVEMPATALVMIYSIIVKFERANLPYFIEVSEFS